MHGDEAERGAQRAGREDPIASATAQLNKTKTPRTESNTCANMHQVSKCNYNSNCMRERKVKLTMIVIVTMVVTVIVKIVVAVINNDNVKKTSHNKHKKCNYKNGGLLLLIFTFNSTL